MPEFDHKGFFAMLERQLPPGDSLPKWLSTHLKLSDSNVYRRIKGDSALQLDELLTICAKLPEAALYVAELIPNHNLSVVQLQSFDNQTSFKNYLRNIIKLFNTAKKANNFRFRYVARDLPLFYFFSNPATLQYKFNQWTGQSNPETLDDETNTLAQDLWQLYLNVPSEEIWYSYAFQAQSDQLQLDLKNELLWPQQEAVLKRYFKILEDQQIEWGQFTFKAKGGSLSLQICNAMHMNNGALIEFGNQKVFLSSIMGVHYFHSTKPELINTFNQQWHMHWLWGSSPHLKN